MAKSPRRAVLAAACFIVLAVLFPSCTEKTGTTQPERDPICRLAPDTLTFGTAAVGATVDRTFTITNAGGGSLTGTIAPGCDAFSIVAGGEAYTLGAGEFRTVRVRFRPTSTGPAVCSIDAGSACGAILCRGTGGDPPPACTIDPASLDFGEVGRGETAARTFTIRNSGGGTLSGTVTCPCDVFSLDGPSHPFSLAAGVADTVTVYFSPTGCGTRTCTLSTGVAACPTVSCSGASEGTGCALSTTTLEFGPVAIGATADRSFQITNEGCDALSGTVGEACGDYQIVSGSGPFILARDQSRSVTVRFAPSACAPSVCVIETDGGTCGAVTCTGSGTGGQCLVSPPSLSFGSVSVGAFADSSFSIRNTGCTTIAGSVGTGCGDFTVTAGAGEYELDPGGSRAVTVRFRPSGCGERSCALDLGAAPCGSILCAGTGAGTACATSPDAIDFGTVAVGESVDRSFTISNVGCEAIAGTITEACADVSIQTGGGPYSLAPGGSRTVSVRFRPTGLGGIACTIETGLPSCPGVVCTGEGGAALCNFDPPALEFGAVQNGGFRDLALRIENNGTETLSGSIPPSCGDFEVIDGSGDYAILPGGARNLVVRFHASACGPFACSLDLGNALCGSVECTGTSGGTACSVTPNPLDFGAIPVGSSADRSFTITNDGCETIAGAVSDTCGAFEIVAGGGDLQLAPGDSRVVTVRFTPTDCSIQACSITTGTDLCGTVVCTGSGLAASCSLEPATLDFGEVPLGDQAELPFRIRNTGCASLDGTIALTCPDYSLPAGEGGYSLGPGEEMEVTVRFRPSACGSQDCIVTTGVPDCPEVACSGAGTGTACALDPTEIPFGSVAVGQTKDLSFQIRNTGCDPISGSVSEVCEAFTLVSGGGDYELAPGGSRDVTVRFAPTDCGPKSCDVQTGLATCPSVACSGSSDVPDCFLSPPSLEFGTVALGQSADRSFSIANNGCGILTGQVAEGCADYAIVGGGGSYQIPAGQARQVTVRFTPTACGSRPCTITTGAPACGDVACAGVGAGQSCQVFPTTLDFGTIALDRSADLDFRITNAGCESISGTVAETCADYSLVSGGGAYLLSPGEERTVTVRFAPGGCGTRGCTITTGATGCANVSATGIGGGTVCSLDPPSLAFGDVPVGGSATRQFSIRNDGCTIISGAVSATCVDYAIAAGDGAFDLAPGESHDVTVRFSPTGCGARPCTIATGSASCQDMPCTGSGSGTLCTVTPTLLDFGSTPVGGSVDRSLTIRNDGCDRILGAVNELCDDFSIPSGGGPYDLGAGESLRVTVRFQPSTPGEKTCTVETGSGACADVSCVGLACPTSPLTLFSTMDATIRSGAPDQNGCLEPLLHVGVETGGGEEQWALFSFDLGQIPPGAIVTDALLAAYEEGCDPVPVNGRVASDLLLLEDAWDECSVTWSNAPGSTSLSCPGTFFCDIPGYYFYTCGSLASAVQGWIADPSTNHGLAIAPASAQNGAATLRSRRFGSNAPQLKVWFTCP